MSKADEIYLEIVDEIFEKINKFNLKTKDEAFEKIENIKDEYISNIETAFDEIFEDYCEEKNLHWEEDNE